MPSDPNARRDKALEAIARELAETNKILKKIERNTSPVRITNHTYLEESGSDSDTHTVETEGTNAAE